ncbi:SPOR domain-containing protein [Thiorhodococcus fuscus]|uniref:SPOR domain-containing protein n=1 Tax=Thiorhodococcus fuscus TaxID=527200 RepID=A0ABW4Y8U3_9GAMM
MPRDYRQSTPIRTSQKRKQNRSCVWWFLMGTALGVLATNILSSRHSDTSGSPETAAKPAAETEKPHVAPNFRFQEILSDTQVDIGDNTPPPPPAPRPQPRAEPEKPVEKPAAKPQMAAPTPTPPAETVTPRSGTYVVQIGSFGRQADAERLKAELALLGISTNIQTATLSTGRVTHRVRTGAYASKQETEKIRAILRKHGKDSMVFPIK